MVSFVTFLSCLQVVLVVVSSSQHYALAYMPTLQRWRRCWGGGAGARTRSRSSCVGSNNPLIVLLHSSSSSSSWAHDNDNFHHHYSSSNSDDEEEEEPLDVRMFLTQRGIQSFMVLLASMHDVHTLNWLDDFTEPVNFCFRDTYEDDDNTLVVDNDDEPAWLTNDKRLTNSRLLSYHGTDAMNTTKFPTWDSYYTDLANMPSKILTIETNELVSFVNGMSEFDVDIHPPRLCSRMIAVREQIAKEWISDLEAIGSIGFDMFYSYWEKLKEQKETTNNGGGTAFDRQSRLFLDPRYDTDLAPSPFRKINYDLLYQFCTQEAVHRVLRGGISVGQDDDGRASIQFLRDFYHTRRESHFHDGISFGRADDFLEELMLSVPQIVSSSSNNMVIVNPVTIAEIILKTRETVANEWQEIMRNVPHEHTDIRKLMLTKMMAT